MQIICPTCGRVVPGEDINVQGGYAKCTACSEMFSFTNQLPPTVAPPDAPPGQMTVTPMPGTTMRYTTDLTSSLGNGLLGSMAQALMSRIQPPVKTEVTLPTGMTETQEMGDLVITRRWFSCSAVFFIVFATFWNGIMVLVIASSLARGGDFPWPASLHIIAGVIVAYLALAMTLNTTSVRVNDQYLTIKHGPMPWAGNRTVTVMDIDQLFCEQYSGGRSSTYYRLSVQFKGGNRLVLINNIDQPNQARFLEQEIERRLRIQDRVVPGEIYS